jgi:hypothetical protein
MFRLKIKDIIPQSSQDEAPLFGASNEREMDANHKPNHKFLPGKLVVR